MSSKWGSGIRDLRGDIIGGTRVERFEEETIVRLDALGRRLLGRGCETEPFEDEVEAIWTYFGLTDLEDRELAVGYMGRVYEYIDELAEDNDDGLFIVPVITPPEPEGSGEEAPAEEVRSIDGEEPIPGELEEAVVTP